MHIIVAVGRKLLSVFYAILKRGIPYNPDWEVKQPCCPGKALTSI